MYWRMLAAIFFAVGAAYWFSKKPAAAEAGAVAARPSAVVAAAAASEPAEEEVFEVPPADIPTASAPVQPTPEVAADSVAEETEPARNYSLHLREEGQRIAAATGVSIATVAVTSRLPSTSPMAMTMRPGGCMLLLNARLPLEPGLVLTGLTLYQQHQLTFTLAHELGHCYMLTRVASRDADFLPSLSPPGKSYTFEQYVAMNSRYSEYPDLNRWNEEWADTFAAYALARAYGKEFAMSVTQERYAIRKRQERFGDVLMSNIYGGHGSLAEDAIFNVQSPLEIANLVKIGRLNTSR